MAAITGAERIAQERGEPIGMSIGYQVRLESLNSSQSTCVLCTHGVLLRTLMGLKGNGPVSNITHIIMDEIHERDKNADFLLIELRRMIQSGHLQRLVIMSATIDLDFFVAYFREKADINPAIISIEGRTGTVERYFLDDVYTIPSCQKHITGIFNFNSLFL